MYWQAVFFDFDGVILDSVNVKTHAFSLMFKKYGPEIEDSVVRFHLENGGVSRYEKFRYYYKHFLKQPVTKKKINELSLIFSRLVVQEVIKSPYIPGALETLTELKNKDTLTFVVSGTPEEEIQFIVRKKNLCDYFNEVHGSPKKKWDITNDILKRKKLNPDNCIFVGDSISDYQAAEYNGMHFLGIVPSIINSIFPSGTNINKEVNLNFM
jgi:HAD superfamily hydrolase (TIGR01549 family)